MISFFREPTLDELLCDPMTQMVMRADRVEPSALRAMLHAVAIEVEDVARQAEDGTSSTTRARSGRNAYNRWSRSLAGWRNAIAGRSDVGSRVHSQFCEGC